MKTGHSRWPSVLLLASLVACSRKPDQAEQPGAAVPGSAGGALETYLQIGFATYSDSVKAVEQLEQRVDEFVRAPSELSLAAARAAWLSARTAYAQSEVFRFYDGPIDQVEFLVNTWPIDENYVESDVSDKALGIVQDLERYPVLSAELLTQLNGRDGETAISTGFHVIEFLLWGRDANPSGPGQRTYQDFVVEVPRPKRAGKTGDASKTGDARLAQRRGEYLRLSTVLLRAHLQTVRNGFVPGSNSFFTQFQSAPKADGLYRALRGMAQLSGPELSGERMTVPYETKNQENEHSCFSDSTQRDLYGNALGIENVCLGRYRRSDGSELQGKGICAVVESQDAALGAALRKQISESVRLVTAIPAPFDQAILGGDEAPGRVAVQRAIVSLRKQAELLEQARARLGLAEPVALVGSR